MGPSPKQAELLASASWLQLSYAEGLMCGNRFDPTCRFMGSSKWG